MANVVEKKLDGIFGIESAMSNTEVIEVKNKVVEAVKETANTPIVVSEFGTGGTDYDYARANIKKAIGKGEQALDLLLSLAKGSEHPRAFEVFGQVFKQTIEANKDLMAIQKTHKELTAGDDQPEQTGGDINIEKAVFVGTTAAMQKTMIEVQEKTKGGEIVDVDSNENDNI